MHGTSAWPGHSWGHQHLEAVLQDREPAPPLLPQQVLSLLGRRAALQAGEPPGLGRLLLRGVARWEQYPEHLVKAWAHLQHLLRRGGSAWSQLTHWQPCQGCQSPGRKQISHSNWVIEKSLRKVLLAKAWAVCAGHQQESCSTSTLATWRGPKGQREGLLLDHVQRSCVGEAVQQEQKGSATPRCPAWREPEGKDVSLHRLPASCRCLPLANPNWKPEG